MSRHPAPGPEGVYQSNGGATSCRWPWRGALALWEADDSTDGEHRCWQPLSAHQHLRRQDDPLAAKEDRCRRSDSVTCATGLPSASVVTRRPRSFCLVPCGLASGGGKAEGNPAAVRPEFRALWQATHGLESVVERPDDVGEV